MFLSNIFIFTIAIVALVESNTRVDVTLSASIELRNFEQSNFEIFYIFASEPICTDCSQNVYSIFFLIIFNFGSSWLCELPNMDIFDGAPDPYAIVHYSFSPENQYIKIGQTQYFDNVRECAWPEVFTFDYVFPDSEQTVKIDVMDSDFDEDDYIGYVEFYLRDLVNTFGNTIVRNISGITNQGLLTITGRVNQTSVPTDILENNVAKIVQPASIDG